MLLIKTLFPKSNLNSKKVATLSFPYSLRVGTRLYLVPIILTGLTCHHITNEVQPRPNDTGLRVGTRLHLVPNIPTGLTCHHITNEVQPRPNNAGTINFAQT